MQKICIIIPCYNEAKRLKTDVIEDFFKRNNYTVLFVNDGSTDDTATILENLSKGIGSNSKVLNLEKNVGKAEAVRQGIIHNINANYDYIGFFDADLSTPLSEIEVFVKFCNGELKHDIIMGSRFCRLGANIIRSPIRHYSGRVFSTFASVALRLRVYDTQCGAKLFSRNVYTNLFHSKFLTKWIFDIEILFRAIQTFGIDHVQSHTLEVPLNNWSETKDSRLRWYDFIKAPLQLLKIAYAYRKKLHS